MIQPKSQIIILLQLIFLSALVFITAPAQSMDQFIRRQEEQQMRQDRIQNEQRQIDRIQKDTKSKTLESMVENKEKTVTHTPRSVEKDRANAKKGKKEMKAVRSANPEDLAKYKTFLKQKNTGIFKLFPYRQCNMGRVIRVDGECKNAVFDSWNYSFSKEDYGGGELKLDEGTLISDSFFSQNMMVNLGNIELANVSLDLPQARFLVDFQPETESKKVKAQFEQISKIVRVNDFSYGKVTKLELNSSFLLRLMAYRLGEKTQSRLQKEGAKTVAEQMLIWFEADPDRRDRIIAFRIIRKDEDGSVTILWKELSSQKSPQLEFDRGEPITDLKYIN